MIKMHKISRTSLYAPSGDEDYPIHNGNLETTRITTGTTVSGKKFVIEDNWRRLGRAHKVLDEEWTGQTVFTVKASARNKVNCEFNAVQARTSARDYLQRREDHRAPAPDETADYFDGGPRASGTSRPGGAK